MTKNYDMLIDGKWTSAKSKATRNITDPGNGELVAVVSESSKEDAVAAIHAARKAFDSGPWRKVSALDRGKLLFRIADAIKKDGPRLAQL